MAMAGCPGTGFTSTADGDCDDTNPALLPGAMVCNPKLGPQSVVLCMPDGTYMTATCEASCSAQPNGTGVCF